jgi:acetyl esterase/lipase
MNQSDVAIQDEPNQARRPDLIKPVWITIEPDARPGWQPRSIGAWLLTTAACLLAAAAAALAICMAFPVRWDGPGGRLGALALFFPLHLLVVTFLAALLVFVARHRRAKLASWVFGLVSILTAVMALTPTFAVWQRARELDVPLSFAAYLANACRLNEGVPRPDQTVVYGTAPDGTKLQLDVWLSGPAGNGPLRPAIVFVNGGAWVQGTRSMAPDWDRWFNQLGYEVFDVEYRLPPAAHWRDEIGDVKSALGWVAAHAAEYHVDPTRINLMGGSAGANLSILAAYTMGDPQLPPSCDVPPVAVRSVINFYGPTDMDLLYRTSKSPDYVRAAIEQYIGGTPEEFRERYRILSPLRHVSANVPPTITLSGTSDRLVSEDHAQILDEALTEVAVPHETILLPGTDHGFDVNWGGFGTQIARARIKEFLRRFDHSTMKGNAP